MRAFLQCACIVNQHSASSAKLQTFFRRNSVYVATIILGAYFGEKVGTRRGTCCGAVCSTCCCNVACHSAAVEPQRRRRNVCASIDHLALPSAGPLTMQAVHSIGDSLWESNNQGVSRPVLPQWLCNGWKAAKHMQQSRAEQPSCAVSRCCLVGGTDGNAAARFLQQALPASSCPAALPL